MNERAGLDIGEGGVNVVFRVLIATTIAAEFDQSQLFGSGSINVRN